MKKQAVNTERKQRGRQFKPGQSGNPSGKPKGARNKATLLALELLQGEASALTRKAIEEALNGNMIALRICLERLISPAKERPFNIDIPTVSDSAGLVNISAAILSAVGNGEIDPGQAASLAKVVEIHRNTIEMYEIEKRLKKMEDSLNEKRN
jgi:hypothetical protein